MAAATRQPFASTSFHPQGLWTIPAGLPDLVHIDGTP